MKVGSGQWLVGSVDLFTAHYPLPTAHYFLGGARLFRSMRSLFCRSVLYRQTGFLPCLPASGEGARFLPSGLSEFLRHTGAGGFARSGAIGD